MTTQEAMRVIEALRKGIPPEGFIGHFTVGRDSEIHELTAGLQAGQCGTLLLKANYGCGKSHLLRFIHETALREGYAVSSVTLDARSAVRFNRMDQIMGAIWRGLEVPEKPGERGADPFLDFVCLNMHQSQGSEDGNEDWLRISNRWRWDDPHTLDSAAIYLALRMWTREGFAFCEKVADWLQQPWAYNSGWLTDYVRHKTPYILSKRCFDFKWDDYAESWSAIRSIHMGVFHLG